MRIKVLSSNQLVGTMLSVFSTSQSLLRTLILLFLGTVFTVGCTPRASGPGSSTNQDQESSPTSYSGAELFEGIILAQGEVAANVDPIREHWMARNYVENEEQLQRLREFNQGIVERVAERQPEFFETFKEDVTSGDRNRIQTALNRGSVVAGMVLANIDEVQEIRQQLRENPDQTENIVRRFSETEGVRDVSVEQLNQALRRFATADLTPDDIPRPLNVDYAAISYVHLHVSVWRIQNYLRDFAVVVDVSTDQQLMYPVVLPNPPVLGDSEQSYRLLHEQTIDSIARELEA